MAWSEGGPEPWWGGPYHAIQNWGWEVLWGSGGFPEISVPESPLWILLMYYDTLKHSDTNNSYDTYMNKANKKL